MPVIKNQVLWTETMIKILITGASGFVGGSFLKRFSGQEGIEIHGVSRRPMPWNNYSQVDLSKGIDIDFKPDVVIHAAAHVSPWGSKKTFYENNILSTKNVINFCKKIGHPKLIYLSSSSVYYHDKPQFDITENSPIGPDFINDYAATKYAGEQCVQRYSGKKVILRPRAIFGPGDEVLFPRILKAAEKGKLPLFTTEEPVIGDLIYIDCLTDYMLLAAKSDSIQGDYNLTNDKPIEIQAVLLSVLSRLGYPQPKKKVSVKTAMRLAGIVEWCYRAFNIEKEPPLTRYGVSVLANSKTFDVTKMLTDFGPPSMTIDQGIENFIQWELENV